MLNVPESVKVLFKQDGIRKNFRVQFPGGELPDITNDNVVQESVRFTESLCSQDVLKFGLTEASVLEFETVGVANMYGMTIEAGIEIDLSSLSAAELAEIEAGSWDGVYVSESDTDIGFPFFRVPYGTFQVESCPRDHQAMAHRRVKAYSQSGFSASEFETKKTWLMLSSENYTINLFALLRSILCTKEELVSVYGYTARDYSLYSYPYLYTSNQAYRINKTLQPICAGFNFPVVLSDRTDARIYISFPLSYFSVKTVEHWIYTSSESYIDHETNEVDPEITADVLASVSYNGMPNNYYDDRLKLIATALEGIGIDAEASGYSSVLSMLKSKGITFAPFVYYGPHSGPDFSCTPNTFYQADSIWGKIVPKPDELFYPYRNMKSLNSSMDTGLYGVRFCRHRTIKVEVYQGLSLLFEQSFSANPTYQPTFTIYTPSGTDLELQFDSTLKADSALETFSSDSNTYTGYSFANAYSLTNLLNSYLELNAMFGGTNRNGEYEMIQLSDSNPVAVSPGLYENFWWDEYDVLPIGTVNYTFENSESESGEDEGVASYRFGDGESIYDMEDNEVLKNVADATTETIETILDETFIPNLGPIAFTPIDLTMKGLPYLEAGDYLAVTAEDGTIANSFAMRQTISGIQVLTAEIESTSGDIIESEEGET